MKKMSEVRSQKNMKRGQRSEVRDQKSERQPAPLTSDLCPLTSALNPLTSDLYSRRKFGKWILKGGLLIPFIAPVLARSASILIQGPVVSAGGCTLHAGSVFNESFEGTGYENSWTESATPNEDAALPGVSPCTGLGSQCLNANFVSGTRPYAQHDLGSNSQATKYLRFYFYVTTSSLASTDESAMIALGESSTPTTSAALFVSVRNDAGQLTCRATGSADSSAQNIATGSWFRAEVKWVFNSAGGCVFRLYDAAGTQIGTDAAFDSANNNEIRYISLGTPGADNTQAFNVSLDGFGIDATTYLGT